MNRKAMLIEIGSTWVHKHTSWLRVTVTDVIDDKVYADGTRDVNQKAKITGMPSYTFLENFVRVEKIEVYGGKLPDKTKTWSFDNK